MILASQPWLPATALCDGVLASALRERANAWATRWFADAPTPTITPRPALSNKANTYWRASAEPGLYGSMDAQALHNLGHTLIHVGNSLQKPTPADHKLLCDLGAACFEDFLREAAQVFLLPPHIVSGDRPADDTRQLHFSICAASIALDLHVNEATATLARKALVERAPPQPALRPREQAIRAQRVTIGAMIGISQLKLAEFYALEAGDVLVLDRGADDEVALTVEGAPFTSQAGIIFREDADLKLRVTLIEGRL